MIRTKKDGFTLMELLVYMAIVGIVVVVAGEAFSNATRFRVRTDNMIKASQEVGNVAMLFKEDVAQMGVKSSWHIEGDGKLTPAEKGVTYGIRFRTVPDTLIYMDPKNDDEEKRDSSSFKIETTDDGFSDFKFRRMRYSDSGNYQAVEEIRWYVEKDKMELKRSCKILAVSEDYVVEEIDPCHEKSEPVTMATGVTEFTVQAAMPDTAKENKIQIFPSSSNPNEFRLIPRVPESGFRNLTIKNSAGQNWTELGGSELTLGGRDAQDKFASNYRASDGLEGGIKPEGLWEKNQLYAVNNQTNSETNWSFLCDALGKVTLRPDTVYELSFDLEPPLLDDDKSLMFVPGKDHMSVGFRKAGSGDFAKSHDKVILQDFIFFPPLDSSNGAGTRTMRFTVPERIDNVCITFTFSFFSPLAADGELRMRNLRLKRVASGAYQFVEGFNSESYLRTKKNVKAFKLKMKVGRGSKNGGGEPGSIDVIVQTPSNGPRD